MNFILNFKKLVLDRYSQHRKLKLRCKQYHLYKLPEKLYSQLRQTPLGSINIVKERSLFNEKWTLANYLFKQCHPASKKSNENFQKIPFLQTTELRKNGMNKVETLLALEMKCQFSLILCVCTFNCTTENSNT